MKRDMNLIREILLAVEAHNRVEQWGFDLKIKGQSEEEIYYHVWLLGDGGFLDTFDHSVIGMERYLPKRITWKGQEFLAAIRDPKIWRKTKRGASKLGGASVEFMWEIARAYSRHLMKEKLGI